MQVTDTPAFDSVGTTPGAVPQIQVPQVQQAAQTAIHNSDEELIRLHKLVPVAPCRYLKEKASGNIVPYTIDFAKRSDLVEAYTPNLAELIELGEDLNEMNVWGYTYEHFIAVGVTPDELAQRGIQMATPASQPAAPSAPGAPQGTPPATGTPAAPATE